MLTISQSHIYVSLILSFMAMVGFFCSGYWLVRQNRPNSVRRFAIGLGIWATAVLYGIVATSLFAGCGGFWAKFIGTPLVIAAPFVVGVMINIDCLAVGFIAYGSSLVAFFLLPEHEKGSINLYIFLPILFFVQTFFSLMRPVLKEYIYRKIAKK